MFKQLFNKAKSFVKEAVQTAREFFRDWSVLLEDEIVEDLSFLTQSELLDLMFAI